MTAQEIREVTFATVMRGGYDTEQVDTAFTQTADAMEQLSKENQELTDLLAEEATRYETEIEELRTRVTELQAECDELKEINSDTIEDHEAVAQALIAAQKTGNEIVKQSREKAEQTRLDAEAEAERIIAEANGERAEINSDVANIVERREIERQTMLSLISEVIGDLQTVYDQYYMAPAPSNNVLDAMGEENYEKYGWVKTDEEAAAVEVDATVECVEDYNSENDIDVSANDVMNA